MTTMQQSKTKSSMSSEAYDLLDCFVSGIDDLVYEIAEAIASKHGRISADGEIEIHQDDVKAAADSVFNAIRSQAGQTIPQEVAQQIEDMHACVLKKCQVSRKVK